MLANVIACLRVVNHSLLVLCSILSTPHWDDAVLRVRTTKCILLFQINGSNYYLFILSQNEDTLGQSCSLKKENAKLKKVPTNKKSGPGDHNGDVQGRQHEI